MSFTKSAGATNIFTLIGFTSQILKGISQQKQSKVEAGVFEFNAAIKKQEADLIRKKAVLDETVQREKNRRSIAEKQAQFVGAGVISTAGSAADVLLQVGEADELTTLIQSFNADIDELRALNESKFQLARAQSTRAAGTIQARTTILGAIPSLGKLKFVKKGKTAEPTPLNFDSVSAFA